MEKKTIVLGVTGSISAFKACSIVSSLTKKGYAVDVILTRHAAAFVPPLTFAALSHRDVYVDEFDGTHEALIPHIELARRADLFVIAPADANILAKAACGIGDDLLSSVLLACTCPILAAPAMNVHMYENPATQTNIATLAKRGWSFIEPGEGMLACAETGKGRLAEPEEIVARIESALHNQEEASAALEPLPLAGKRVVVSAGPTQEALDPVRFLSNHSSGKQGFAIATAAAKLGADTVLVAGPVHLPTPENVKRIDIVSALDLEKAMKEQAESADFIIMAAAVADYRFATTHEQKMKKSGDTLTMEFVKSPDILRGLGQNKRDDQVLCGFAMETENLDANAREKMLSKNCDLLVANNLHTQGAGFMTDTNIVTLMTPDSLSHLPLQTKEELGRKILLTMLEIQKGKYDHASVH